MYVIFPADELVYLSYGHLIYVPSTPEPENQLRSPPIRASIEESDLFSPSASGTSSDHRESTTSNELIGVANRLKSVKSKQKPKDVYCIGSRSIDLETKESTEKIRIDGLNYESRGLSEQRENTCYLKRADIIGFSPKTRNLEQSTQSTRSFNPESSFFLNRYATNTSIKLNSFIEKEIEKPSLQHTIRTNRSEALNRPIQAKTKVELDKAQSDRFNNLNIVDNSSQSVKTRNQTDNDSYKGYDNVGRETLNRSLKIKSSLEAPEYTSFGKSKTSKVLGAREVENTGSRTLERGSNCNSNKSSKSSKNSSNSSKSVTASRSRKVSDTISNPKVEPKKKPTGGSFRSFLGPSALIKEKTPDPPVRPERKKNKKTVQTSDNSDRRLSYSDYIVVNRERVPRSDIINTRSDKVQEVREKPTTKREKSPGLKFFRAQSSSPRTLGRDRTAFDFDGFFKNEPPSPGKLSVNSAPLKTQHSSPIKITFGSESNVLGHQSGEAE